MIKIGYKADVLSTVRELYSMIFDNPLATYFNSLKVKKSLSRITYTHCVHIKSIFPLQLCK